MLGFFPVFSVHYDLEAAESWLQTKNKEHGESSLSLALQPAYGRITQSSRPEMQFVYYLLTRNGRHRSDFLMLSWIDIQLVVESRIPYDNSPPPHPPHGGSRPIAPRAFEPEIEGFDVSPFSGYGVK